MPRNLHLLWLHVIIRVFVITLQPELSVVVLLCYVSISVVTVN